MQTPGSDQIQSHEEGIDAIEIARLKQDSQDLARQDGRSEARNSDHALALHELHGTDREPAREIPPGAQGLVAWDVAPEESGHLTEDVPAEDEATVAAEMAGEGRAEAEQDLRRSAQVRPG